MPAPANDHDPMKLFHSVPMYFQTGSSLDTRTSTLQELLPAECAVIGAAAARLPAASSKRSNSAATTSEEKTGRDQVQSFCRQTLTLPGILQQIYTLFRERSWRIGQPDIAGGVHIKTLCANGGGNGRGAGSHGLVDLQPCPAANAQAERSTRSLPTATGGHPVPCLSP